jgi:tetratricopeptide (TPR) repeat protein
MPNQLEQLKVALADRYAIERELGSGGMATVYLAEDLKHRRQVAVKVLRPELAATLGPERFIREVELAAQLTHPHILPLHDSGEAEGFLYYVMPYIKGESLRDRLEREGELPIAEAVRILREVVDALAYAHGEGVVHRDIKPDNVLLSGRHAVVTDFGVAKAVSEATGRQQLTTAGVALGTPAYMAPEQAAADPHIDHRADIYAVGAMAYEILTGSPPFTGNTAQQILSAHVTQIPDPVSKHRETVPPGLADLVMRCLEKKAADRWQSAEELIPQLEALATPSGGITPTGTQPVTSTRPGVRWKPAAIAVAALAVIAAGGFLLMRGSGDDAPPLDPGVMAVMPFRVSGTARRDSSVADLREGMLDLLNATFTGDQGLRALDPRAVLVAWRSRTDDEAADLPLEEMTPIAAGLGAGRLLVGGIVGTQARLTISATLHDLASGEAPLEVTTTGSYDSLPQLIDRFAAQLLSLAAGEEAARLPSLAGTPLPALQAYLSGQRAFRRGLMLEAVANFDRALELDSTFALAATYLAWAGFMAGNTNTDAGVRGLRIARSLRDHLSAHDQAVFDAFGGSSTTNLRQILRNWERALELAGDRAEVWMGYAGALGFWGEYLGIPEWRMREEAALDRAWELDSTDLQVAVGHLFNLQLDPPDTARARRAQRVFLQHELSVPTVYGRWYTAVVLGDSAELHAIRPQLAQWQVAMTWVGYTTVYEGLPFDDWERAIADFAQNAVTERERHQAMEQWRKIARQRGRLQEATLLGDSLAAEWQQFAAFEKLTLIRQALLGDGGDSAAAAMAATVRARPRARNTADIIYPELWKVTQTGDTSGTRDVIRRAREIIESSTIALLLEAVVEALDRDRDAHPIAERLDSLLSEGIGCAICNYLLARMYADRGEYGRALHLVRRRLRPNNPNWQDSWPAFLREEGRLAVLAGDTEGAIEAYSRYLELRTDPDPGFMQEQVDHVRAELTRLLGERGGRN